MPVVLELTLAPSEVQFAADTFLADLAQHLGGILPQRLSIPVSPSVLESGHRVVKVRVDSSAHDIPKVRNRAMMLPFGNRVVGGFSVTDESLHNDDGANTGASWAGGETATTVHTFMVGVLLESPMSQYSQTSTMNAIAAALNLPAGDLRQRESSESIDPVAVFNKPWVQIQAVRRPLEQGMSAIYSYSGVGSRIDEALSRSYNLPWVIDQVTTVVAGVYDRPSYTPESSPGLEGDGSTPPGDEQPAAHCGSEQRELCISVVVNATATVLSTPWFQSKLASWMEVDKDRLRRVSVQLVTDHPSWAHIKIDKGPTNLPGMMMATFAVEEGRHPSLDQMYSALFQHTLFHLNEVARVSAGMVAPTAPAPPSDRRQASTTQAARGPPPPSLPSMRMSGYL